MRLRHACEGLLDYICRRLGICFSKTFSLFPKRIHQRLHEFGLNSNYFLEILGLTQLLYKFMSRGDILLGIAFEFFPKFCPPGRGG